MKRFFIITSLLMIAVVAYQLFTPQSAYAVSFDLEVPSGELVRDEEYDFIVTIDSQGEPINTAQAMATYETQYLELVSVTNGDFFDSVSYSEATTGNILLEGTNTTAKTGSGTFAVIRFKLIATAPGSTQLCTVSPVTPTPTPTSTTPSSETPTPVLTSIPTAIPTAGISTSWKIGSLIALSLIGIGVLGILLL